MKQETTKLLFKQRIILFSLFFCAVSKQYFYEGSSFDIEFLPVSITMILYFLPCCNNCGFIHHLYICNLWSSCSTACCFIRISKKVFLFTKISNLIVCTEKCKSFSVKIEWTPLDHCVHVSQQPLVLHYSQTCLKNNLTARENTILAGGLPISCNCIYKYSSYKAEF